MAYNGPQFTTDYIAAIEAGNLFVKLAIDKPEIKSLVVTELRKIATNPSGVQQCIS